MKELAGEHVRLTPLAAADAPALRAIRTDPRVAEWWDEVEPDFPLGDEPESTRLTIHHEGEIAGMIQFGEETEPKYRQASIDIFVAPAHQGRGVGTEAIALVVDHLVSERGHHRITIDPATANAAAIACYSKAGFTPVGVMRMAERDADGRGWHDSLMMELVVGEAPGGVFAVVLTGPPGAGKTVALTALTDALIEDELAHAAADVDEVAWGYPFPSLAQRCEHLRAWAGPHRRLGRDVLLVAEVIESPGHLDDVLAALGADDHLLVRLVAAPATLRARIVAREPEGWFGLEYLLGEIERLDAALAALDGVHLVLDSEQHAPAEIASRIRAARPDRLARE
jgi:aminoglycoside 6'-N-acetyltransferase